MIKFKNIKYNKEYKELIEAFIPNEDKGLILVEKYKYLLKIFIDDKELSEELEDIQSEKTKIKKSIYKILSNYTKKNLPWGILVGVNPLKLFRKLEKKNGRSKAINILENVYLLDKKKIKLGFQIIDIQKPLIKDLKGKTSIYIDIPFCPTKCFYCSYSTYKSDNEFIEKYVDTVIYELDSLKDIIKDVDMVYIGGGTPSAIDVNLLEKIIKKINSMYKNLREFTVEIGRPDTINEKLLKMLKRENVGRISINPQTLKEETLEKIGRKHNNKQLMNTFSLARKLGFSNINMDLIIGLPGEDSKDFQDSLTKVLDMNPESVSIHSLAIKKGSKLFSNDFKNIEDKNFEEIRDKIMEKSSLIPYYLYRQKHIFLDIENIGYSKENYISKYNIAMMEDLQNIIGIGLGGSTKIFKNNKIYRHMNYRLLEDYIKNIDKNIKDKRKLLEG